LPIILLMQSISAPVQAYWTWYQPAPVVVYHEPSAGEAIVTGIVALGACIGLGAVAIAESRAQKRQFKEYVNIFKNMGYSREQSRIYAQMAMKNPEGLTAVMHSIDQEKLVQTQAIVQHRLMKESHSQKLQEMSHEHQLKLMTYLVMLLSAIILAGIGFALYRRRK
jgi:hypothetical protein